MKLTVLSPPIALFSACMLVACQGYEVTLNEQPVYQPPKVLTDFRVADSQLQTCIDQTIKDTGITAAGELKQLNCSNAGIQSLVGLELFANLEQLNLSDNAIADITTLAKLGKLKTLLLTNNRILSAAATLTLINLQRLEIGGNNALACADLYQLQNNTAISLTLPQHCQVN